MSPWWGILAGLFPRSGTFFPPERDVFPPDSEFLTREGIDDTVVLGNLSPPLEMNFHSGTLDYLSAPYRIGALAIRYLPPAPTGSIRIQGQQVLSSTHFIQPTLFILTIPRIVIAFLSLPNISLQDTLALINWHT